MQHTCLEINYYGESRSSACTGGLDTEAHIVKMSVYIGIEHHQKDDR